MTVSSNKATISLRRASTSQRSCAAHRLALNLLLTDPVKLTDMLHDRHTSLHAQCQQGPSNVSAWMSNAVCERQCAMTCMHFICFKLLALNLLVTDSVQLTALLHDPLTSLHAQCQQGPSNVSAWMSNAVCEQQCAQTCMHFICFKLPALNFLLTDPVKLTEILHDRHISLLAQCPQGPSNVSA